MKKFLAVMAMVAVVAFAAPALAATNPFMDVPQGHWAYDAVALLASRGIVSGYPDGAFKGAQPATRYEMASVVARALVYVDANKASKEDLELLKKLVMEFKDELDALGVKVDGIDKRVAVLEDGIGGWKIRGTFRFDAKFATDTDNNQYYYNENGLKNDFEKEQFRLFLTKQISENVYFYAQYRTGADGSSAGKYEGGRGDLNYMRWSHLFVNMTMPYDWELRVGRFAIDFEGDYGLYADNDALFGDYRTDGFRLTKKWGNFKATGIIGRNNQYDKADENTYTKPEDDWASYVTWQREVPGNVMNYVLDLNYTGEKFMIGGTGYWWQYDGELEGDYNISTYALYAGYKFTPAVALKAMYYWQSFSDDFKKGATGETSPKAWKAILDIKQEALKFTSLWVEYSQEDNTFMGIESRYSIGGGSYDYVGRNWAFADPHGTSKWWFATAKQQWNDKWSTFLRYANVNYDTDGLDNATEWGIGVGYQYTPAVYFELAFDQVDHGNTDEYVAYDDDLARGKDHVLRFRTNVSF